MTLHKDALGYGIVMSNSKTCPSCGYPKVSAMQPGGFEDKDLAFVAWCPCGCIFTQDNILEDNETAPAKNKWWERTPGNE